MAKVERYVIALVLLFCSLQARAQFYFAGNDPASAKYRQIRTDNFRIIYPIGADSLARVYALKLELQYPRVGRSIGYESNELCSKPMPVILRSYTGFANGMMMWAPRRMELFTVGDAYSPDPMTWVDNLAIHEQRHGAQLQLGRQLKAAKATRWLAGDLSDVAWWAVYQGITYSEGDAVAAETGLSNAGRGRTADFLEYMRVCFDEGDWRDFYRWRFGSQRLYTPDHYRAGYMIAAGVRNSWDIPDFSAQYLNGIRNHPITSISKSVSRISGQKFKDAFRMISEDFHDVWEANDSLRAPFIGSRQVSGPGRRFESFGGAAIVDGDIYAIETGLEHSPKLVKISSDGRVKALMPFASQTSPLKYSRAGGCLYWSENRPDMRWELKSSSAICRYDLPDGKCRDILKGGRYYNPAPSPDGKTLAVAEYPMDGSTRLLFVDAGTGSILNTCTAPSGMQIVEPVWIKDKVYVSAIVEQGFGIYDASDGFATVLEPMPVKVKQLQEHDGILHFVCDFNGVNELYSYDGHTLRRLTSLRHGGQDFLFAEGKLYFTELSADGRMLACAALDDLHPEDCDLQEMWRDPVAEKLSRQERYLASGVDDPDETEVRISEPEKYGKMAHLLRLHSWVPVYFDYDKVESLSFDSFDDMGTLGAMAFFQNDLATATGIAGYSASPDGEGGWRHAMDLKFNYTGWYPVIETSFKLSNENALQYRHLRVHIPAGYMHAVSYEDMADWSLSLGARVYLPLVFNSRGWIRGVIPTVSYSVGNERFNTSVVNVRYNSCLKGYDGQLVFDGAENGQSVLTQNLSASLRAYTMLPVAESGIYPKWGIGAEAGIGARPSLARIYAPAAYAYIYGYLPGIIPEHGLRLSATVQKLLHHGESYFQEQRIVVTPRGITGTPVLNRWLAGTCPVQTLLTAEYKMAVLPLDWSGISPVAYLRNFELGFHGDCMLAHSTQKGNIALASVGASLAARLGNLLMIPFDTRVGVRWSYNCGPSYHDLLKQAIPLQRHSVGMTFTIDY